MGGSTAEANLPVFRPTRESCPYHTTEPWFSAADTAPVDMEKGRIIDYTIRLLGLPIRWRTIITTYKPPRCFVDEQISGPYSFWHHTHRFEPRDGGTLLYDEVRYVLPMALIAPVRDLAHTLYVRPSLDSIFDYREQVFTRLFGGKPKTGKQASHALARKENMA